MPHVKWPSIESLRRVIKIAELEGVESCLYRAKVKLHGTNAAIRCDSFGQIMCQSRTHDITPNNDNVGFARHVHDNDNMIDVQLLVPTDTVVFGEWCGPGIQKGTAINKLDKKIFAVFSVKTETTEGEFIRINDPDHIKEFLGPLPDWVYILPWYGDEILVDFNEPELCKDKLEDMVASVENCDPWVKDTFGVEGIGEGLVLYPVDDKSFSNFAFKVKGEKHKVKATKQKVEINPETLESINAFVEAFATPARLEQCLNELQIDMASTDNNEQRRNTGNVIKWMALDIHKESDTERADLGIEWKQLHPSISARVREMYFNIIGD